MSICLKFVPVAAGFSVKNRSRKIATITKRAGRYAVAPAPERPLYLEELDGISAFLEAIGKA
jgi:hypothetical protein